MPIIYSYPKKTNPVFSDLLVISDVENKNRTRNITISALKDTLDVVDSLNSLTGDIDIVDGVNTTVSVVGQDISINIPADTVTGTGIANRIPMWSTSSTLSTSSFEQSTTGGGVFQVGTQESVYIGKLTNESTTATVPQYNVGIGDESLKSFTGGLDVNGDEVAGDNVAVGYKALTSLATGTNNIGLGVETLLLLNSGSNNIAIGKKSLSTLFSFTGDNKSNIAIGFDTLGDLTTGAGNVAVGQSAFDIITTASNSTALGHRAGKNFTGDIDDSVVLGYNALVGSTATSAKSAVLIGRNAGQQTSGTLNDDIFIGLNSGGSSTSAGSNIAIGSRANAGVGAGSRTGSIAIGTTGGTNTGSGGTANSYATVISSYDFADVNLGGRNSSTGKYSAIVGGLGNTNNADYGIIMGGRSNVIQTGALNGSILGGFNNLIESTSGSAGFAVGSNITVAGQNQLVTGRYNVSNTNTKFIVGTGTGPALLKNGFEVLNTGQIRFAQYGLAQSGSNVPFPQTGNNWSLCSISRNDGKMTQITKEEVAKVPSFATPDEYTIASGGFQQLTSTIANLILVNWSGAAGTAEFRLSAQTPNNRTFTFAFVSTPPAGTTVRIEIQGVLKGQITDADQRATFLYKSTPAPGTLVRIL